MLPLELELLLELESPPELLLELESPLELLLELEVLLEPGSGLPLELDPAIVEFPPSPLVLLELELEQDCLTQGVVSSRDE